VVILQQADGDTLVAGVCVAVGGVAVNGLVALGFQLIQGEVCITREY
jgi:hypothetical protein